MLAKLKGRRVSKLGAEGLLRFAELYRATTADLAVARLRYPRSGIVGDLNKTVAQAHNALYTEPHRSWQRLWRLMRAGFPQAVRRNKAFVGVGAALFVAAALGGVLWFVFSPDSAKDAFGLHGGFNKAEVPLSTPGESVVSFFQIAVNNIQVAFVAFALGVFGCLGAGFVLVTNGLLVGAFGGVAFSTGHGGDFLALIVPHGLVELTVIILAGSAGVRIGWAIIAPGRRRRSLAIVAAGKEAIRILVGTVPFFILAAIVEGFVTTAGWPVAINVAIGVFFAAGFWAYLAFAGRQA